MIFCSRFMGSEFRLLLLSSLLLSCDLSLGVDEVHVKLACSVNNLLSLSGRDVSSDFSGIDSVVHQQTFEISRVSNQESLEAVDHHVSIIMEIRTWSGRCFYNQC